MSVFLPFGPFIPSASAEVSPPQSGNLMVPPAFDRRAGSLPALPASGAGSYFKVER